MVAILLLIPTFAEGDAGPLPKHDNRIATLSYFMQRHGFAQPYYVNNYIQSADNYEIDWRLLPAITLIESSGCRFYPRITNNCWGYGSSDGLKHWDSIPEGIDFVNQQLANNRFYKDKDLYHKITTYNSVNPKYYGEIKNLMDEMAEK